MSQWLQCILLRIHEYEIHVLYTPSPNLYIAEWLSKQNHAENKNKETEGIKLNIDTISKVTYITTCMSIQDIAEARQNDMHLQELKEYTLETGHQADMK